MRRHEGKVLANCRYLTGSADDAQDLAQEVFVKAFFALKRFRGEARVGTWIQRIKVNHCLNFLRKQKNKHHVDVDDPVHESHEALQVDADAEQAVDARDRRQRIAAALDQVPETLRMPLVMCDLDEMSYQEIADSPGHRAVGGEDEDQARPRGVPRGLRATGMDSDEGPRPERPRRLRTTTRTWARRPSSCGTAGAA